MVESIPSIIEEQKNTRSYRVFFVGIKKSVLLRPQFSFLE